MAKIRFKRTKGLQEVRRRMAEQGDFKNRDLGIVWSEYDKLYLNYGQIADIMKAEKYKKMENLAGEMRRYMKANHPWINRTGKAERSLRAQLQFSRRTITELSNAYPDLIQETPALVPMTPTPDDATAFILLAHGATVKYGNELETSFQGRYQIIWPTILAFMEQTRALMKELLRDSSKQINKAQGRGASAGKIAAIIGAGIALVAIGVAGSDLF